MSTLTAQPTHKTACHAGHGSILSRSIFNIDARFVLFFLIEYHLEAGAARNYDDAAAAEIEQPQRGYCADMAGVFQPRAFVQMQVAQRLTPMSGIG